MKVVVTGGTGLIGSHLVDALRDRGDEAIVVSRSPDGPDTIGWEPTAPGSLELPEGTDAVVHLAGAPLFGKRWNDDYKQVLRESRVDSTRTVNQAIRDFDGEVQSLISSSAVGYYGDRGDETLTEDAEPADDFLAQLCVDWEQAAQDIQEDQNNISIARLRTGVVLAPDGGALDQMLNPFLFIKPFHWGLGGPLGDGSQFFPWIHIDDEVGIILHILDNQLEGAFNMAGPNPVRNKEFTKALGEVLNRPTIFPVPKIALRLLYGEVAKILYASQRVMPSGITENGYQFQYPDVKEALEDVLARR